jgi:glycosyltransferase involved in cell wall biosynthesis
VHCHIHHSSGFILLLAAWMRVPIRIVHSHNDTLASDARKSILRRIYDTAMKLLMRRYSTAGIAISRAAARSLFPRIWMLPASTSTGRASKSTDGKWEICPYGIDLEPFRVLKASGSPEKAALRVELDISPAALVIGHVGRFAAQKNHPFLIEIAACVCRREPAAVFLLVGVGPDRAAIEASVAGLGLGRHFVFAGSRPDVPRLMKDVMDCFLFPSFYEGLGLVLWEAQAAGLPCLIADALPEEASIVSGLVQRLSLSLPPAAWAADLLHLVKTYRRETQEDFCPAVSAVSIEASASRLIHLYDGYMDPRRVRTVRGLATA